MKSRHHVICERICGVASDYAWHVNRPEFDIIDYSFSKSIPDCHTSRTVRIYLSSAQTWGWYNVMIMIDITLIDNISDRFDRGHDFIRLQLARTDDYWLDQALTKIDVPKMESLL